MIWNEGYFDILGHSAPVSAQLNAKGEEVAANARGLAKVDTGRYRDSITVSQKAAEHREVVIVSADVPYGMVNEGRFGTLNKALRASGV